MLKILNIGPIGGGAGDTAPVFGDKVNHMFNELYTREGVNPQTKELPSARPLSTGGTGATTQADAAKNILPAATAGLFLKFDGTNWVAAADNNTTYTNMSAAEITAGTGTTGRLITPKDLKAAVTTYAGGLIDNLSGVRVYKASDATKLEYLELITAADATGSTIATRATGAGTARTLSLGAGARTHMQLDPTGNIKLNPLGVDGLSTEITSNFGSAGLHTLSLRARGTATGQAVGVAFYPTFGTGTDVEPRRAASISAGYGAGTWGKEFLDFSVGGATDAQNVPTRRMSIGADGVVLIGDGGNSQARLYIQSYSNGTTWGEREFIIENRTQDSAAMTFHAAARTSAAILKWNGVNGHFEFRNSTDTSYAPIAASVYTNVSDYRLKNITGDVVNSGSFIDALKPRVGTWKEDGSAFVGFVAHEVQEVSPSSVIGEKDKVDDNGKEVYQSVAYSSSEIIANLVAELQSLRKRVAELEAKAV